eukprot:1802216-Pyramimonas_sp.AAC.1
MIPNDPNRTFEWLRQRVLDSSNSADLSATSTTSRTNRADAILRGKVQDAPRRLQQSFDYSTDSAVICP